MNNADTTRDFIFDMLKSITDEKTLYRLYRFVRHFYKEGTE